MKMMWMLRVDFFFGGKLNGSVADSRVPKETERISDIILLEY